MTDLHRRFPWYSRLLKLYPAPYRRRYEQEVLQVTADMLDGAHGPLGRTAIWLKLAFDVPIGILAQQLSFTTGPMSRETPRYIKLASIISSLLVLPFFIVLALNTTDRVVFNRSLYNSWLWDHRYLSLWAIRLPWAALVVAAVCYLAYILVGPTKRHSTWWRRAVDVKLAWPVLVPLAMACGILVLIYFHDSAHCWVHNPAYVVNHLSSEWRCTQISG